jgi:uncharacterized protein (DUF983 family)
VGVVDVGCAVDVVDDTGVDVVAVFVLLAVGVVIVEGVVVVEVDGV